MLYVIWSIALMIAGLVLIYRSNENVIHMLTGMGLQIFSVVLVANYTIIPAYHWISKMLPNQGEVINHLTAGVVVLAVIVAVLVFGNAKLSELGK
ncbi:hypothetical protein ACFFU8_09295 [Chromobacterium piscinae]|uniref:hypothetical protein n=1 Tax=Chromobacterium piscinae TaxID=686831 RepID=UPI001E55EC1F|nr:hypothetical protein [Chromobacterium piscinae]MCD5327901.1 hypothetical protein [Chromobacterium piscinae]